MQQTIDIPSPSGADTETVVTALETAAIFGAKGDGPEAMRWLRRAAESAGAAGDDERALSLSRIAADLQDELRAAESPPPLPARVSYPPPPSARAARPSSVPRPSQAPRPSSRPSSRPSYVGASRTPLAVVPSQPAAAELTPAELTPALAPVEPAPAPAPAAVLEAPPLLAAPPVATSPVATAAEAPSPPASVKPATAPTGARHAARVAVAISTTKAGFLEVRLLAEGEAPRLGSSEALLVMLDPASTLLAR